MSEQGIIDRYACLLETGVLASHATMLHGCFRARTLRFFINIFANWLNPALDFNNLPLSNTHLSRYLTELENSKLAKSRMFKGHKHYLLTEQGLVTNVQQLTSRDYSGQPAECLFVKLFLSRYLFPYLDEQRRTGRKRGLQLLNRMITLSAPALYVRTQIFYIEQAINLINTQIAHIKELELELSTVDITAENFLEHVQSLEENAQMAIHSSMSVEDLLIGGDVKRVLWELKQGCTIRRVELYESAVRRLELLKKELES